jgi:hypothetical protein
MGNDTTEDSNGYDRSSAVSGVQETWISGFMSGLAHHVSQSTISLKSCGVLARQHSIDLRRL